MAAYRTASRCLASCHIPDMCIAMEFGRVNNFNLAKQFMRKARDTAPQDPLVWNELGLISYKNKK